MKRSRGQWENECGYERRLGENEMELKPQIIKKSSQSGLCVCVQEKSTVCECSLTCNDRILLQIVSYWIVVLDI